MRFSPRPFLQRRSMRAALFAPYLLSALLVGCQPSAAPTPARIVSDFAAHTDFNGVVLVARDDSVLHAAAHGVANAEAGLVTQLDTRYQLGSICKWVSSLVVLRLVDSGRLSLEAPIRTYLPDYRADTGSQVTLHHLLTHTSGVPNDIVAAIRSDPSVLAEALSTPDAVTRYASGDLLFEPGSAFDYSHSNWILVKAIIEQVTHRPFAAVVDDVLVVPAGLPDTGVFAGDPAATARIAVGYETLAPAPVAADAVFPDYLAAAGGIYSTAPDLLALLHQLYTGRLLSADLLARLDAVAWPDEWYAYGGRVREMMVGGTEQPVAWHTGSNGPSKARVSRVLSSGLTVILLSNTDASHDETGALTERLFDLQNLAP